MKTAFIGIDYIVDIIHPQGKIARAAQLVAERHVVSNVNKVLAIAEQKNWLKVLVKVGFSASYVEQPKQSPCLTKLIS